VNLFPCPSYPHTHLILDCPICEDSWESLVFEVAAEVPCPECGFKAEVPKPTQAALRADLDRQHKARWIRGLEIIQLDNLNPPTMLF